MFEDGSLWRPPQMNPYAQGMPDELVEGTTAHTGEEHSSKKPALTDGYVSRWELANSTNHYSNENNNNNNVI